MQLLWGERLSNEWLFVLTAQSDICIGIDTEAKLADGLAIDVGYSSASLSNVEIRYDDDAVRLLEAYENSFDVSRGSERFLQGM